MISHSSWVLVSDGSLYSKLRGPSVDESLEMSTTIVGNVHIQFSLPMHWYWIDWYTFHTWSYYWFYSCLACGWTNLSCKVGYCFLFFFVCVLSFLLVFFLFSMSYFLHFLLHTFFSILTLFTISSSLILCKFLY